MHVTHANKKKRNIKIWFMLVMVWVQNYLIKVRKQLWSWIKETNTDFWKEMGNKQWSLV